MAATANIELDFAFTDGTTSRLTLGPFAPTANAITRAKANIMAINAACRSESKPNWFGYLLNANGAAADSDALITNAVIVTSQTTEIDLTS